MEEEGEGLLCLEVLGGQKVVMDDEDQGDGEEPCEVVVEVTLVFLVGFFEAFEEVVIDNGG